VIRTTLGSVQELACTAFEENEYKNNR